MLVADNTGLGIGLAIFLIAWVVIGIGSFVFFIVALVDIAKRPDWQWKIAGQEKILWLLLVILVNFLAIPALIYWFNIRKKLQAVEAAAAKGQYGPGHMTYAGWEPAPVPAMAPRAGMRTPAARPPSGGGMEPVDGVHVGRESTFPLAVGPLRLLGRRPRPPRVRDSSTSSAVSLDVGTPSAAPAARRRSNSSGAQ